MLPVGAGSATLRLLQQALEIKFLHRTSPDLGEDSGDWRGLSLINGTYTVGMHAVRAFTVSPFGEPTNYNDASKPSTVDVLLGDATAVEPDERISSPQNCNACHNDIAFHGSGRRSYQTCLLCHVAANAPATTGVTIDFRNMLHQIHHGKDLAAGDNYIVVAFGFGYPNNFTPHTYDEIGFPVLPWITWIEAMLRPETRSSVGG